MSTEIELKIYTGSIPRGLDSSGSEQRRLYEAIDEAALNGTPVTITRYGRTFRLVPEEDPGYLCGFFCRPGKTRVAAAEVGSAMSEVFAMRRECHTREYMSSGGGCWWIVADREIDDDTAERIFGHL